MRLYFHSLAYFLLVVGLLGLGIKALEMAYETQRPELQLMLSGVRVTGKVTGTFTEEGGEDDRGKPVMVKACEYEFKVRGEVYEGVGGCPDSFEKGKDVPGLITYAAINPDNNRFTDSVENNFWRWLLKTLILNPFAWVGYAALYGVWKYWKRGLLIFKEARATTMF